MFFYEIVTSASLVVTGALLVVTSASLLFSSLIRRIVPDRTRLVQDALAWSTRKAVARFGRLPLEQPRSEKKRLD